MNGNPFGYRDSAEPRGRSSGVTAQSNHLVTGRQRVCAGATQSKPVPNWPAACQLKGGHRAPGTGKSQSCGWKDKGDLILQSFLHAPGTIPLGSEVLPTPPPSSSTSISAKSHSI